MYEYTFKVTIRTDESCSIIESLKWLVKQKVEDRRNSKGIIYAMALLCKEIEVASITKEEV